jgi:hypothetical protein
VAAAKVQREGRRKEDASWALDGELQGSGPSTQDDMLTPGGVEEYVLDIGKGGNKEPWPNGGRAVDTDGVQVQSDGSGLGQPDRMTLPRRQPWINESRRGPTSRRRGAGPAGG